MDKILQIILIIGSVIFTGFIILKTSKNKLNYKLTILWLFFSVFIVGLAIFPQIIIWLSQTIHIETPVNALFLIFIFLLIIVLFYISVEISKMQNKITILIQEKALLNKKLEEKEEEREKESICK